MVNRAPQDHRAFAGLKVSAAIREARGQQERKAVQVLQGFGDQWEMKDALDLRAPKAQMARAGQKGSVVIADSLVLLVVETSTVLRALKATQGCLVLPAKGAIVGCLVVKASRPSPRICGNGESAPRSTSA